jgi:2,3-bisphosphoglycerate-dependent phosphoglycerate mutase
MRPSATCTTPYPNGESWVAAIGRVGRFVDDLPPRWNGRRILVIGHIATLWGLAHRLDEVPLDEVRSVSDPWREGWELRYVGDGQAAPTA